MMEGRHQGAEQLHGFFAVVRLGCLMQGIELFDHVVRVDSDLVADEDLFVGGGLQALLVHQQLLKELFARTQTREHDRHILVGDLAVHADQVFGEGRDLDRRAHVEHKDLAALCHGAGFEHQRDRLGDRHKVTDDVGMRDRDGCAALDLAAEERDHRAVGAEHIAEARGDKLGVVGVLRLVLDDHLAGALGGAHDVGGIDRLVGGDHHEFVRLVIFGERRHIKGAEDVVLDRFLRHGFHQRHVLVRRRVKDHLRTVLTEDGFDLVVVAHRGDECHKIERIAVFEPQLLLDVIGVVFVNIDDNDLLGVVFGDLAHQLAADGAAAAGDHADLAADKCGDLLTVKLDGLSAEQVFDLDLLCLREQLGGVVVKKQLAEVGHHLDGTFGSGAVVEDLALLLLLAGRDGDDDRIDIALRTDARYLRTDADDLYALESGVKLGGIVVHHTDRQQDAGGIFGVGFGIPDLVEDHASCLTGADDHRALHSLGLSGSCQVEEGPLERKAEQQNAGGRHQIIQQKERLARHGVDDIQHAKAHTEAERHRKAARQIVAYVKIPPEPRVRAEQQQHQLAGQNIDQNKIKQISRRLNMKPFCQRKKVVQNDPADGDDHHIRQQQH